MLTLYSISPVEVVEMALSCTVIGMLSRPAKIRPSR